MSMQTKAIKEKVSESIQMRIASIGNALANLPYSGEYKASPRYKTKNAKELRALLEAERNGLEYALAIVANA